MVKSKTSIKKYSCIHCGSPFDAYPPDDIHVIATRDEIKSKDVIKVDHKCVNCNELNTIYWKKRPRPRISVI